MANFLTAILMVLTLSACSESRFAQNSLLKAKPNGDSDKISDGSEGVPGYLTDPGSLRFSRVGDQGTVIGSAGAVTQGAAKLSDLVIELWGQAADATELSQARKISTSSVAADGSFTMQFNLASEYTQLVIAVERSPGSASLRFVPAGNGRYQAASRASVASDQGFNGIHVPSSKATANEIVAYPTLAVNQSCAHAPSFSFPFIQNLRDESTAYRNFRLSNPRDVYEFDYKQDTIYNYTVIRINTDVLPGGGLAPVERINFNLKDTSATFCLDVPGGIVFESTKFILGCGDTGLYFSFDAPIDEAGSRITYLCN